MHTYIPNNLWGVMLNGIDNDELYRCCLDMEKTLLNRIVKEVPLTLFGSKTTAAFNQYNLLTMPLLPFYNLYHKMVEVIKPCLPDEPHAFQSWLNIFRDGESIDWHGHWDKKFRAIHGFYCVNVSPSFTEYRLEGAAEKTFKVESKEGLLVIGKSNNNNHRSSPWHNKSKPRVTIAFDIIPLSTLEDYHIHPNHLIPF
jgi:hypothetical protein